MKLQKFVVSSCYWDWYRGIDVRRRALVVKDGPQCPGDDKGARKVTISGGKRVRGGSSLQEEAKRDEYDQRHKY